MSWTVPKVAECDPGIHPTEYMVVVRMATFNERTAGGILLTDATKQKEGFGATHARLVAVSPLAFTYAKWPNNARQPQVGDTVFVGKFPGEEFEGRDGEKYRICTDREIAAVIEQAKELA